VKVKYKNETEARDVQVVISQSTGVRINDATLPQLREYLSHGKHTHEIQDDVFHVDFDAPNDGKILRLFQY
jgi:hypothetical protein